MTQPAVTRAIQELEQYYGVRLFDRIKRRLSITEAGKSFYAFALHIVDSFEQMEQGLRNWDELGVLRLGSTVTLGTFLMPKVLSAMTQRHPELQLRGKVSNSQSLQQALLDNQLDFAAIEGSVSHELLQTEMLGEDHLLPVLPPDSPHCGKSVRLEQLCSYPLLLREPGSAGRGFLDSVFAVHSIQAIPVLESISTQAILQAVHDGLGVSFLPQQLVQDSIQKGFVGSCLVSDENFQRKSYLVWHKHKFLSHSAREAMELFRLYC